MFCKNIRNLTDIKIFYSPRIKQKVQIPLGNSKENTCLANVEVRPPQEKAACLFPWNQGSFANPP